MKKYTAKILATALYRASLGKEGKELEKIMNNFSSYLMDHRLVAMIPGILKELENLHFNTEGIVVANITSREELSPAEIKTIEDLVSKKTKRARDCLTALKIPLTISGAMTLVYKLPGPKII